MAARRTRGEQKRSASAGGLMGAVQSVVRRGLDKIAQVAAPNNDGLDAMDLLRAQHGYVDKLFARVQRAEGDERRAAFAELADMLAVHAAIEEKIFYPAVKLPATEDLLLESAEEHLAVKRVLADMLDMDADAEEFDAKLSVLEELVRHHAKEEEEAKLFPLLRVHVSGDLLAGLASEMIAMMVDLQQQGAPRRQVAAETAEAAPV